jgi:hypothetical protein
MPQGRTTSMGANHKRVGMDPLEQQMGNIIRCYSCRGLVVACLLNSDTPFLATSFSLPAAVPQTEVTKRVANSPARLALLPRRAASRRAWVPVATFCVHLFVTTDALGDKSRGNLGNNLDWSEAECFVSDWLAVRLEFADGDSLLLTFSFAAPCVRPMRGVRPLE